ncbi:MAG: PEP-CTERM sorting domain-containing protein [Phycisphaerae bacterium]|nr:PEP-CTERM sorting domain-containing protein [Gemmatimonadaceae bacterium]
MRHLQIPAFAILLLSVSVQPGGAQQTTLFNTNPFAGSTALTTPGRQVVGNEPSLAFNIATDVLAFERSVFNMGTTISFANGLASAIPSTGLNAVVLQSFDNDGDSGTPFGAGNAANLLAAQITSPGAGLFVYFNSGLDLARLVYSTDLSDNTADLKVLARFTNLSGQSGRDAFPSFTSDNFALVTTVPEPSSMLMAALGLTALLGVRLVRGNRARRR